MICSGVYDIVWQILCHYTMHTIEKQQNECKSNNFVDSLKANLSKKKELKGSGPFSEFEHFQNYIKSCWDLPYKEQHIDCI